MVMLIQRPDQPRIHAHKLIAATAQAMAHELYDTCMHNNHWYGWWKKQHPGASSRQLELAFVRKNAPKLVESARAILARRLDLSNDEAEKSIIYEALLLDNTLVRGRH